MRQELLDFLDWTLENVQSVDELIDEQENTVDRYLLYLEEE